MAAHNAAHWRRLESLTDWMDFEGLETARDQNFVCHRFISDKKREQGPFVEIP